MGKSCIRFKKLDDLPLAVIGEAIARMPAKKWMEVYKTAISTMRKSSSKSPRAKPKAKPASKKSKSGVTG
jgi:hypothetical protein